MFDNPKFLFGKYKGRAIANVPRDYLEWYLANVEPDKHKGFRKAVEARLAIWNGKRKENK